MIFLDKLERIVVGLEMAVMVKVLEKGVVVVEAWLEEEPTSTSLSFPLI